MAITDLGRMRRYGVQSWAERAPRKTQGNESYFDNNTALGRAGWLVDKIESVVAQHRNEIADISKSDLYSPKGKQQQIEARRAASRQQMTELADHVAYVRRERDKKLAELAPKAPNLDPAVLELRSREVRERIAAEFVANKDGAIINGVRPIARLYEQAIAAGDLVTVHALDTAATMTVYPAEMRLSADEIGAMRAVRLERDHPADATALRDLNAAIRDLDTAQNYAAEEIEGGSGVTDLEQHIRSTMQTAEAAE